MDLHGTTCQVKDYGMWISVSEPEQLEFMLDTHFSNAHKPVRPKPVQCHPPLFRESYFHVTLQISCLCHCYRMRKVCFFSLSSHSKHNCIIFVQIFHNNSPIGRDYAWKIAFPKVNISKKVMGNWKQRDWMETVLTSTAEITPRSPLQQLSVLG